MTLGFLPNRDAMCKEVEQWIVLKKIDTLLCICDCCAYKAFKFILPDDCRSCIVGNGILAIMSERTGEKMQRSLGRARDAAETCV